MSKEQDLIETIRAAKVGAAENAVLEHLGQLKVKDVDQGDELDENGVDSPCWWMFTFMFSQELLSGRYVKIYGTHRSAREKMVESFGVKWAFQYDYEKEKDQIDQYELKEI